MQREFMQVNTQTV